MEKKDSVGREPAITEKEAAVNETVLEIQQETERLRRRDRLIRVFGGVFVALMLGLGIVTYVYGEPDPGTAFLDGGGGYNSSGYPGTVLAAASGSGGSCCVTPGSGGGSCGMAGAAIGDAPDNGSGAALNDELKELALAKYKEETGKDASGAKVTNFGCHLQVDILDDTGATVRSYGYQGGPLYVIS